MPKNANGMANPLQIPSQEPLIDVLRGDKQEKKRRKLLQKNKRRVRDLTKRGYTVDSAWVSSLSTKSVGQLSRISMDTVYRHATKQVGGKTTRGTTARKQERKASAKKAAATRLKRARDNFYSDRTDGGTVGAQADYPYESDNVVGNVTDLAKSWQESAADLAARGKYDSVKSDLSTWTPSSQWSNDLQRLKQNDVNLLVRLLDSAVEQDGIDAVAKRLQEHSEEIAAIMQKVMYESGGDYRTTGVHGMQIELSKFATILKGAPLDASESLYLTDLQESMNYSFDTGVDDEPDYDVYI